MDGATTDAGPGRPLTVVVTIPGLVLTNPLNGSWGHWSKKAKQRREQKVLTRLYLSQLGTRTREALAAVTAGATDLHVHPRTSDGRDSVAAELTGSGTISLAGAARSFEAASNGSGTLEIIYL